MATLQVHGNTGSTETFSASTAEVHTATLDSNCTFTFSGSSAGVAVNMELHLKQDGTGGRTVTWPASVKWVNGVVPALSSGANITDRFIFQTVDNGTTWLGQQVGREYA